MVACWSRLVHVGTYLCRYTHTYVDTYWCVLKWVYMGMYWNMWENMGILVYMPINTHLLGTIHTSMHQHVSRCVHPHKYVPRIHQYASIYAHLHKYVPMFYPLFTHLPINSNTFQYMPIYTHLLGTIHTSIHQYVSIYVYLHK